MFIAVVVGILIAAASIKGGDTEGTDEFIARQAWLYVSIVTAGYLVSRGPVSYTHLTLPTICSV